MRSKLPLTVLEARKILGADAKNMSDEEIMDVLIAMTEIANTYLSMKLIPKSE
jgi:hypothetical protein